MSYELQIGRSFVKYKNKDDVISHLMSLLNGDGTVLVKLTWPDGSYLEYEGGEE